MYSKSKEMEMKIVPYFSIVTLFLTISVNCLPTNYNHIQLRYTRDAKETNSTKIDSGKKNTLIDDIESILEDSSKILRSLIEIQSRVLPPLVDGIGKIADTISKSEAIDRTMEAVGSVGEAGIKASTGITSTVTRTGNSTSPGITKVTKVVAKAVDIGDRLVRLSICGVVCPLQNGQERKDCAKKNCGKDGEKSKANKNKNAKKEEPVDAV